MPVISVSSYPGPPFWQFNGHLQTIVPGAFRKVSGITYTRERIQTPDDDFLDLDWIRQGHRCLVVLSHGLEGNSDRQYILGTAKLFASEGWDVLAWNCRSCSGEMNRNFRMYHHGDVEDIGTVVQHALRGGAYDSVALIGYSMGANITMKYLGVNGASLPPEVKTAAVFSAPCDIEEGANVLDRWDNSIYRRRFLKDLQEKIKIKDRQFPGRLDMERMKQVRRWRDFDEWFSAPISGYRNAEEFYQQASAKHFIAGIRVPTLLVNAANDPILTEACMPFRLAHDHHWFYFEQALEGGHCGFQARGRDEFTWAERRSLEFCSLHV